MYREVSTLNKEYFDKVKEIENKLSSIEKRIDRIQQLTNLKKTILVEEITVKKYYKEEIGVT